MDDTQLQQQSECRVTVNGKELPIVFTKTDGGKVDSPESKTFPGGMRPQKAHTGLGEVENVTLMGEMVPARDHAAIQEVKGLVGKSADVGVVEQGLDSNGNVWGILNRWNGKLKSVDTGNYDASSTDPRPCGLEVSTHGVIG
jgi:hypothetical protein